MNKVFRSCVGMLFAITLLAGAAEAAEKFGYVDLGRIFKEYKKTQDYDKTLSTKENSYKSEREKKVNEVKQLQEKFSVLSEKEKAAKKTELETKVRAIEDLDRQKQGDLRKEFMEKKDEIIKDIDTAIKDFAKKEGFTFIFNEVGVVYNVESLEVTDKILEILNKGPKK